MYHILYVYIYIYIYITEKESPETVKLKTKKLIKKTKPLIKEIPQGEDAEDITEDVPIDKTIQEETKEEKKKPEQKIPQKLTLMKIEKKTLELNKPQHAESIESPQFVKLKLKKPSIKPKQEATSVTLPKFQLKSRIKYVSDWPPAENKPIINYLGSVRQNGILSRNVKEAAKIKKKPKLPKLSDLEKPELDEVERFDNLKPDDEVSESLPFNKLNEKEREKPIEQKSVLKDKETVDFQQATEPKLSSTDENIVPIKDEPTKESMDKGFIEKIKDIIEPDAIVDKNEKLDTEEMPENKIELPEEPEKPIEELSKSVEKKKRKPQKPKILEMKPIETAQEQIIPENDKLESVDEFDMKKETPYKIDVIEETQKYTLPIVEKPSDILEDTSKPVEKKNKKQKIKQTNIQPIDTEEEKQSLDYDEPSNLELKDKTNEVEVLDDIQAHPIDEAKEIPRQKLKKKPKSTKEEIIDKQPILSEKELPSDVETEKGDKKIIKPKLVPMKIERKVLKISEVQHAENIEGPQFVQIKLKKSTPKQKQEASTVTLPKFQLKSRIKYIKDWPPIEIKPIINYLGSIKQNGVLSRNIKEATKIKKKVFKPEAIPDLEKTELEKPMFGYEDIIASKEKSEIIEPAIEEKAEEITIKPKRPSKKIREVVDKPDEVPDRKDDIKDQELNYIPKEITASKQSSEDIADQNKYPKDETDEDFDQATIKHPSKKIIDEIEKQDNVPEEKPEVQDYDVKESPKEVMIKPKRIKVKNKEKVIELEDTKPEKEEILDLYKTPEDIKEQEIEESPEQVTIKPKRPSKKISEEITDEVVIKKKLKPVRKSSIVLSEISEPESVTFRPKSVKTKEDVEQEFNIHLDSYAEEEISMSSKVKLKPQRQPTFGEEANETSIKFFEEKEGPDVVEIIDNEDDTLEKTSEVMMPFKKKDKKEKTEDITSSITVSKPKHKEILEVAEEVNLKLDLKPKYTIDNQDEVSFDIKTHIEPTNNEDISLSSKIKLKSKKPLTVSEAADETSIQLTQEIEDDSQAEEIILSETESDDNVEMIIKRKPKKQPYEISEVEELSIELKPKQVKDVYEEENLTISTKRKPKKPTYVQGKQ